MNGLLGDELLRLPVRVNGIELGHPVDLVLDRSRRVVGLDVRCGDQRRRFLPLAAAHVGEHEIALSSPLVLLDEAQVAFYRAGGTSLSVLRGAKVLRHGREEGRLADVELGPGAEVIAVLLADARKLPLDEGVHLVETRRSAA
jgi:hypothetical protein